MNDPEPLWGARDFYEMCSRPNECRFRLKKVASDDNLENLFLNHKF